MKQGVFLLVILLCGAVLAADNAPNDIETLRQILFSKAAQPAVSFNLKYRGDSPRDYADLTSEPVRSTEFDCSGVLDLATGRMNLAISHFKTRLAGGPEPYEVSTGQLVFDGTKWVHVSEEEQDKKSELKLNSRVSITAGHPWFMHPQGYLLGFPLFRKFVEVQFRSERLSLAEALGASRASDFTREVHREGTLVKLTLKHDCVADELTFDSSRSFALVERLIRYNVCPRPMPGALPIVEDHYRVTSTVELEGISMPGTAEMTQTVGGKVRLRRSFVFTAVALADKKVRYEASIPERSLVIDERTGKNYITESWSGL